MNQHEETLSNIRRMADGLGDLGRELEVSAEVRSVARELNRQDQAGTYRLPYTSRPDFIGDRWNM
ncbi:MULTISPECIES: hypothetical protein [unclassified Pseudoxanthomonas]|uniref:hypothetical protein n=1 Tax=unclassified Pseudoxanthomonas TaxID=2645906 RepID=UPI000F62A401|nr:MULTISPECIES: hypothetical protein [unclassified Pseudoxanthomonas]